MSYLIALLVTGTVIALGIAIYPAMRVLPFAYSSARFRSARSTLLKDEDLEQFATSSYKEVLYQLEKKGFYNIVQLIDSNFREDLVQKDLRQRGWDHLSLMLRHTPRRYRRFFKILHSLADLHFIMTALRSKVHDNFHPRVAKALYVQTPYFNKQDISDIQEMDLQEFLRRLQSTPYHTIIKPHTAKIIEGDFKNLEKDLNQRYYSQLRNEARIDPILKRYVSLIIDLYNVRNALTFGELNFIKGGKIEQRIIEDINASKSIEKTVTILQQTPFAEYVKDKKTPVEIVQGLFKFKKKFTRELVKKEPLSISPILAYYVEKKIEIKNITIILKLINAGFSGPEIRRSII